MQRYFYATADDLLPVFEHAESKHDLAYTLTGLFHSPVITSVHLGAHLPSLRFPVTHPNASCGSQYLISPSDSVILVRDVLQHGGDRCYAVDQLTNPDSITIQHGGFYRRDVLLCGRVSTISDTNFSKCVYRTFASAVGNQFVRVRALYVGSQAHALLEQGCRLAIGGDSPAEYDLAR